MRPILMLTMASTLIACQSADPLPDEGLAPDELGVQDLIGRSVDAENARDADAFLAL